MAPVTDPQPEGVNSRQKKIRVACVGDSITWGFTIVNRRKNSYPAVLQELLGPDYEVRNFGHNDASARFDADTPYVRKKAYSNSRSWNPDIVLLMLGTNDTKRRNWDPAVFRRDYTRLVESYQALPSAPRIVLIAPIRVFQPLGIPLLGLYSDTMENGVRPAIHEIAAGKGLELIDLADLFTDSRLLMDGVHPQAAGARLLAARIHAALAR